jgi:hypothetical protein
MSPLWHFMFWVALPAALYLSINAYADWRGE